MKLWWIPKLTLPAVSCLEQIISFNQPFCWWKFAGFHRLKCRRDAMRTAQAAREQPEHTESSCSKCRGCVLQDGTLDACREERMWHPGLPGARGRECWCSCSCSIHSFTLNFSSRWRAGRSGKLTLQEGWCGSGSAVSQGQSCPFRLCWSWKKPKNSGAGSELEAAWQAQPSSCQLQLNPCMGSEVKVSSGDRRENTEQAAHREELFCRGAGCPPFHLSLRKSMENQLFPLTVKAAALQNNSLLISQEPGSTLALFSCLQN